MRGRKKFPCISLVDLGYLFGLVCLGFFRLSLLVTTFILAWTDVIQVVNGGRENTPLHPLEFGQYPRTSPTSVVLREAENRITKTQVIAEDPGQGTCMLACLLVTFSPLKIHPVCPVSFPCLGKDNVL